MKKKITKMTIASADDGGMVRTNHEEEEQDDTITTKSEMTSVPYGEIYAGFKCWREEKKKIDLCRF